MGGNGVNMERQKRVGKRWRKGKGKNCKWKRRGRDRAAKGEGLIRSRSDVKAMRGGGEERWMLKIRRVTE